MDNLRDEEILTLSLQKPSVFEALVDKYQTPFLRTAKRIVLEREEAEDVVQEVFTKIYTHAKKFHEIEGGSFKSWAYKILINTSLNHYQKQKKIRENFKKLKPEFYEIIPDGEDLTEEKLNQKMFLERAILSLPKKLRDSVKKYYLEEISQKEMAKREGVSVTTIKMRLFRARKMLKKFLENTNFI